MRNGLLLLLLINLSAFGSGSLVFENTIITVEAGPHERSVTINFPFTTEGDEVAVIETVKTPCTCIKTTIGQDDRKIWNPGEQSFVRAIFEIGTFRGTIEKSIQLMMKGGERHELIVLMTTPELMTLEPKNLKWVAGEDPNEKVLTISLSPDYPVHVQTITNSNPGQFEHQIETIDEGKTYRVRITPKATDARALGVLRIETDCQTERHRNYQAFMAVEKRGSAPNRNN